MVRLSNRPDITVDVNHQNNNNLSAVKPWRERERVGGGREREREVLIKADAD